MAFIEFTIDGGTLYIGDHLGKPNGGPRGRVLGVVDYDRGDFETEFDDLVFTGTA